MSSAEFTNIAREVRDVISSHDQFIIPILDAGFLVKLELLIQMGEEIIDENDRLKDAVTDFKNSTEIEDSE